MERSPADFVRTQARERHRADINLVRFGERAVRVKLFAFGSERVVLGGGRAGLQCKSGDDRRDRDQYPHSPFHSPLFLSFGGAGAGALVFAGGTQILPMSGCGTTTWPNLGGVTATSPIFTGAIATSPMRAFGSGVET